MRTRKNRTLRTKRRKNRTSRAFRTQRGGGTGTHGQRCEISYTGTDTCIPGVKCIAPKGEYVGTCVDPKKPAAPVVAPPRPLRHIFHAKPGNENGAKEMAAYKALANEPVTPFEVLIYTVQQGNPREIPELLRAANTPKPLTPDQLTAVLATAINRDDASRVNAILQYIKAPLNDIKINHAVKNIIIGAAAAILRKHRDRNEKVKLDTSFCEKLVDGMTPYMVAFASGSNDYIRNMLIEKGGTFIESVLQIDANGGTPLIYAIRQRNIGLANKIIDSIIASNLVEQEGDRLRAALEEATHQSDFIAAGFFNRNSIMRMSVIRDRLQAIVGKLPKH